LFSEEFEMKEAWHMSRIMLADDYEVVRQRARRILESREDWEICGLDDLGPLSRNLSSQPHRGIEAMEEIFARMLNDLIGRIGGPMSFRLILQPATAFAFAIRDGLKDAREGQPAYFYSLFTDPVNRRNRIIEAFKAVSRVFAFAIIMDLIYQVIVLRWFYPLEALIVAFVLAFLPYILLRGPVNRIARFLRRPPEAPGRRLGGA